MFRLGCLCLQHMVSDLHKAKFGPPVGVGFGADLSHVIEPMQSY